MLQGFNFACNFFNAVERQGADFRVFQRNCIAGVAVSGDAIQAEYFAGHLKTSHLYLSIFGGYRGFKKTTAYCVKRRKSVSSAEKCAAPFHKWPFGHQFVNTP